MSNQTDEDTESTAGAGNGADPAEPNRVVGPLTDDELKAGSMEPVVAYVRRERSKEAKRQAKHRDKLRGKKRQINVVVADDERSRVTVRAAAAAIKDEICHQAIEALLAKEDLRTVIVDMAARDELKDIVEVCRRSAAPGLFETVKAVGENPDAASLVRRIVKNSRRRATVEAALAHPAFVLLGQVVATQGGPCGWLARRILRVRKRKMASGDGERNRASSDGGA